nr:nonstructural protein 1 [Canary chaphamaparvovirus 1]
MQEEVEGSRRNFGYWLWMGTPGTSGDLNAEQTAAVLVNKDYVLSPYPETEKCLKIQNMREWLCGIFQICNNTGIPIVERQPYALLLNQLHTVEDWIITGEYNKDGIFHTHVLFRTGVRSDSLRRSLYTTWNNLMGSSTFRHNAFGGESATMDCLKLQRCHKPESMFCYLMKAPQWCISNKDHLLQLAYDIDQWNLAERFRPKEPDSDPVEEVATMNTITAELLELITEHGCKSFEDCLRQGPLIMQKYLHRPGLVTIVQNCLQFVKSTGNAWTLNNYAKYDPNPCMIHRILLFQGIKPCDFDEAFYTWITKKDTKRNTICLYGPSNTGKSAFIFGFKQCVNWGEVVNSPTFAFEALIDANFAIWEEPLISPELAEKTKQVMEGMTTSIPIKHKKPQMLNRTPLLMTTNHYPWRFCTAEEQMFRNRMWIWEMMFVPKDADYISRTSEHRCKCCYCRASCGCQITIGEPSTGSMQGGEQSIPAEQSFRTESFPKMGTGSMLGAGEGTSGSNNSTPGSSSSSSNIQCSNQSESGSSTRNTTEQHMGTFRIIRGNNPKHRLSSTGEHVESNKRRRRVRNDSSPTRSGPSGGTNVGGDGGGIRQTQEKHDRTTLLGYFPSDSQRKVQTKTSVEKFNLDKFLESLIEPLSYPMYFPLKQDWCCYLSYLLHRYG